MLLTRLLPDVSDQVLSEGWHRPAPYQARHGRPPALIRTAQSAAMMIGHVRERYLGADGEEAITPAVARPPRTTS